VKQSTGQLFAKVILDDEVPQVEENEMFDKLNDKVINNPL